MRTPYKTFDDSITINGSPINVEISIFVGEDDLDPEGTFDCGDEVENEEYLARFKSGELFMAVIGVEATALDETGTDYLGGCHIHANSRYSNNQLSADVAYFVEAYTMVENAKTELKDLIIRKANQLARFATEA